MPRTFNSDGSPDGDVTDGMQYADASDDGPIEVYKVVNNRTGQEYGPYSNRKRARNVLDKRDNEYGGYVHRIVPVQKQSGKG